METDGKSPSQVSVFFPHFCFIELNPPGASFADTNSEQEPVGKKAVLGFYSCYATTVLTNGFESECSFAKCLTFLNPSPHKELRCSCFQKDAKAGNFNYQQLAKEDSAGFLFLYYFLTASVWSSHVCTYSQIRIPKSVTSHSYSVSLDYFLSGFVIVALTKYAAWQRCSNRLVCMGFSAHVHKMTQSQFILCKV